MTITLARERAAEFGVTIIGAGQAGGRVAESLRSHGFAGRIQLIGDEEFRPYERPSLSKEMLIDLESEAITWLHDEAFYAERDIELELGARAVAIDREAGRIALSDGSERDYGVLVLATGARVRELAVEGAAGRCHYLRSIEHSRALRQAIRPNSRLVVIGAGFIGLEVAAAARMKGASVTIVESASAPLARIAPPALQEYARKLHVARGVTFFFSTAVERISDIDGGYRVDIGEGRAIDGDIVVAGIGAIPNVELAAEANLACDRGILVDAAGLTSDPWIFAVGDVAQQESLRLGRHVLLESWQNAQDRSIEVGALLADANPASPKPAIPWFWSDQYDRNIQMYGLAEPGLDWIERGSSDSGPWMAMGLRDGRILCATGANAGRDLRAVAEMMKLDLRLDPASLADPATNMTILLKSARLAEPA